PTTFKDDLGNDYSPANYQNEYGGAVTLRDALAHSRNIVAIKVAEAIGYGTVADLGKKVGFNEAKAFPSIALGVFEATVASRPEDLEGSLSLMGEKGSIIIGGSAVNKIHYWKFIDPKPEDEAIIQNFSQDVPNVYGRGHTPYMEDVVRAIKTGGQALVEGPEGRKDVEILTALYESAACSGKAVTPGCRIIKSLLGKAQKKQSEKITPRKAGAL
ncbi:MAG: Gfo/Idh/MocA family oxidoreductase, partial [Pseudomonadota bacterium]